jgi:lipopolysaccharide export system protein LptC
MNTDRLYPIVALALLAAATIWLERTTRSPEVTQRVARTDPDFIGYDVRVVSFDINGKLSHELEAARITHYPASDITEFEQPNLRYNSPKGQTTVTAAYGESSSRAELVELRGDVVAVRKSPGSDDMVVESQEMSLWPDAQRAASDSPVVLKHGNITAYGEGMRADNLAGTLELVGAARVQMPSPKRNRQ